MALLKEKRLYLADRDVLPMSNLLDIQVNSFEQFCFEGVREVFDETFPIVSNDGNLELSFDDYYITLPEIDMLECFEQDKTFSGTLRGIFSFFNKKTGKWICGETEYERLKQWATEKV